MIELGAWLFYGISIVLAVIFSYAHVTAYMDQHEFKPPHVVVATVVLLFPLAFILLVPLDVCSVSSDFDAGDNLNVAYFVLYFMSLVGALVLLPVTYHYFKQPIALGAALHTFALSNYRSLAGHISIAVVFGIASVIPHPDEDYTDSPQKRWIVRMFEGYGGYEKSLVFSQIVFGSIGFIMLSLYLGNGLFSFPYSILIFKQQYTQDFDEAQEELSRVVKRIQQLDSRYTLTGKRLPKKERAEMDELKKREKILKSQVVRLEATTFTLFSRVVIFFEPVMYYVGILLSLVSTFVILSLSISLLDRCANNICTTECGFIMETPMYNPLDQLLISTEKYYPLDYFLYIIFIWHIIMCVVYGINQGGVYKGSGDRATPFTSMTSVIDFYIALGALVLSLGSSLPLIYTLLPKYSTFGTQSFSTYGEVEDCTISVDDEDCTLTEFAKIHHRLVAQVPIVPYIHIIGLWVIIFSFLYNSFITIRASVRRKDSHQYERMISPQL